METPKLDQLIKMYKEYDSKNYLTDEEKEELNEFVAIKQALRQPLVIGSVCRYKKCNCEIKNDIGDGLCAKC